MSPVLRRHFADYAAFHGTAGNRACHYVGIPLIVVAVLSLLGQVPLVSFLGLTVTLAEAVLLLVTVYYVSLDVVLGVLMLAASILLLAMGRVLGLGLAIALFVVGWIFQFVGHCVYERKSPAFYRNLVHLLVGPLWILAKATRRA
jgi:uncharacterized membrane protein YGL010W